MRCPMPLLKLKQMLVQAEIGDVICLLATDTGVLRDIPAFVAMSGHRINEQSEHDGVFEFLITKGV